MHQTIRASIEIIQQGQAYLSTVSSNDYTQIVEPYFIGACGGHMRHIIDHFLALQRAGLSKKVDYDVRSRGSDIETEPQAANRSLNDIIVWLRSLSQVQLSTVVEVSSEISLNDRRVAKTQSTLERELLFASSHAVHHYAMIAIAARMLGVNVDQQFGIAPATATYLRKPSSCAH